MTLGLVLSVVLGGGPSWAHDANGPWRTVTTEHYRVHFPVEAEPWALHAAERLESVRARVVEEVGYDPPRRVDLIVRDPYTDANGMAIPLLGSPRIEAWTTPPGPESVIGDFRTWDEMLLSHETAHIVHLVRPSRNPLMRTLGGVTGIGPLTFKSPRWVIEGYATVVEGRVSGSGRPHGDYRATLLRKLALEGRLPSYRYLDASSRWMGGSYAYLVGSAFLEWLEDRTREGALRDLWARMSAKKDRSFIKAFQGVFGDTPDVLYDRFRAELTHAALDIEEVRPSDANTLWMEIGGSTGAPAVSPDGKYVAAVVRSQGQPPRLHVYPIADDGKAKGKWEERVAKTLADDPHDVAPVPPPAFGRETYKVRRNNSRWPSGPRYLADGSGILFSAWLSDADGRYRPDLLLWDPEKNKERRVTHGGDVADPDPAPDGTFAVAVHHRFGTTAIARVDLATGEVTDLTERLPDVVHAGPRLSPDGSRVVWIRNGGGHWGLRVLVLADGSERDVALPEGASPTSVAFEAGGTTVLAALGRDGFSEVWRVPLDGGPAVQLTHTLGGAFAPEPEPDGRSLFFLSIGGDGLDLHHFTIPSPPRVEDPIPPGKLAMRWVSQLPEFATPVPERQEVVATPYKARPEVRLLLGGGSSRGNSSYEVGARLGDLVGRYEGVALLCLGDASSPTGGGLRARYRGWAVDAQADAFLFAVPGEHRQHRVGGALSVLRDVEWTTGTLSLRGGGWMDAPWKEDGLRERSRGFGEVTLYEGTGRPARLVVDLHGQGGATAGKPVALVGGSAFATIGRQQWFGVGYGAGHVFGGHALDAYRAGGFRLSFLPDSYEQSLLEIPWLTPDELVGERFDSMRAELRVPVAVFIERDRVWASNQLKAATEVGLEWRVRVPGQAIAKLAPLESVIGAGCELEDPVDGWSSKPCTTADAWSLWGHVDWGW